jgi:hypothetical protein
MQRDRHLRNFFTRWIYGFIAGLLATLTFHQIALLLLRTAGIAPFAPYNMTATQPFGIPAVFSLALWGGAWGILFAILHSRFPGNFNYWIAAFGFGAIFPSLVALLIVAPMKGNPIGGGWHGPMLLTALLINGAWGAGTGVFLNLLTKISPGRREQEPVCSPGMTC